MQHIRNITRRKFSKNAFIDDIHPKSTIEIFTATGERKQPKPKRAKQTKMEQIAKDPPSSTSQFRENELNIQMLSKNLYEQIFANSSAPDTFKEQENIQRFKYDLLRHNIKLDEAPKLDDVVLKLPTMRGKNIEEHFHSIASDQTRPYTDLVNSLLCKIPDKPTVWSKTPGWTCYDAVKGPHLVPFPDDDALVFDIEVCMSAGSAPTLACAVGRTCWYSWTSKSLTTNTSGHHLDDHKYTLDEMIPIESKYTEPGFNLSSKLKKPKVIVGHNVSYDRARIKEQYWLENTGLRFVDTMSLHVCVSGVTSYQRAMLKANKDNVDEEDVAWSAQSSLNGLKDVYQLYCEKELDKVKRDVFVHGTLADVQEDFQNLMTYCAIDVIATHDVLCKLFPLFTERFPHPVTFAGMLEIGTAYLPVNSNWNRYIDEANLAFEDLNIESKYLLARQADDACQLLNNESYKQNLWMWDQDWSVQQLKIKAAPKRAVKKGLLAEPVIDIESSAEKGDENEEFLELESKFKHLFELKTLMPARRPLLPGYPTWYRKLCTKVSAKEENEEWQTGPHLISTGMQVTPKLLSLCWEGFPLHFIRGQGWGFLVPHKSSKDYEEIDPTIPQLPLHELIQKCPVLESNPSATSSESDHALSSLWRDVESKIGKKDYYSKAKKDNTNGVYKGTGVWCDIDMEECCWFFKLPHKDGGQYRVGNPLAKDFLNKFSENVLSGESDIAERIISIARMVSYWRNNRDRVMRQMVVWLANRNISQELRETGGSFGAIIPQVVVCGTLTRRAMEPTWMTASNAQAERVGSELRSMIQAPKGYRIVGADVDSQELWIASILGDAHACGAKHGSDCNLHGATPFGWMTLSGTKSSGTDMHSVTAKAVGISRDHAKVINYARIYGAGMQFAERLLKQFNPTMSDGEAKSKAIKMFTITKGKKLYFLLPEYQNEYESKGYSGYEALRMAAANRKSVAEMFHKAKWNNGTESAMFNRLEEIAEHEYPSTPFLQGRLSRALEPQPGSEDRFLPTRINWVVQSGAVDFLHLMLVCMRWLMGPKIRFCLSFHDEVRYLVAEEHCYEAALAMHVTNLLTRAFCASRIGLRDLPQSVAFFTSVEVDTVLRKEAQMDCKTPSNPHGLSKGYNIKAGESLDIHQAIKKAGTSDLSQWS